ncbi:MAG: PEGA domain-containing protein [Candidatus Doudnabacteria bacterium]|nr:PEGA domain-containing protein [Candidatus Doudnabacteria bacterium]
MKRRTRYFLIAFGFIFFLITAPLFILYLSGIKYDFDENRYVKTGILVANTEPEDVEIYIDDVLSGTSPDRVKFISPGEHEISLQKEGYFKWTKRLELKSGKVTWVAGIIPYVTLLKSDPKTTVWADNNVIDFDFYRDGLIYLSDNKIVIAPDAQSASTVIPIPTNAKSITLSPNRNTLLIYGEGITRLILDLNTKQLTDITNFITPYTELQFSATSELLAFNTQTGLLSSIDFVTNTQQTIANDITAVTTIETTIYALRKTPTGNELITFSRNGDPLTARVLTQTPAFTTSQIIVTKQKEIFILGDNTAYVVGTELNKLAEGVTQWSYNPDDNSILLISPSELHRYTVGSGLELISRSSLTYDAPFLNNSIGYAFYGQDGYLQALELDRRDHQNNYRLKSATQITKILSKDAIKKLFVLSSGKLEELQIR